MRKIKAFAMMGAVTFAMVLGACDDKDHSDLTEGRTDTTSESTALTETDESKETAEPETTIGPEETESSTQAQMQVVAVNVKTDQTYQTWSGFGAGFTWYADWVTKRKDADEIYDCLFDDLGFTTLRFRNTYGYNSDGNNNNFSVEKGFYDAAKARAEARGEEVSVLLTSWSPAGYLKSNGKVEGDSTLAKDENGNYRYEELGQYFADAVECYNEWGVPIDYLSIQNELDYSVDYDCCLFDPKENDLHAGYSEAFLASYHALEDRFGEEAPRMLGPEPMTLDSYLIRSYVDPIREQEPEALFGIAHHLYAGGGDTPVSFFTPMTTMKEKFPTEPKWMTEYYCDDALTAAEYIMRSITLEETDCWLYWGGVWDKNGKSGLVGVPWDPNSSYDKHENYYAMKAFSKFIRPGYARVDSKMKGDKTHKMMNCAFVSEDGTKIAMVILNPTDEESELQFNIADYTITGADVYLSDCREGYNNGGAYHEKLFQEAQPLGEELTFVLPGRSFLTVDITGHTGS